MGEIKEERAMSGWKALSEYTGICERKLIDYKDDLQFAGAIYYVRKGRPPKPRMYWFPTVIRRWVGEMSARGIIL